MAWLSTTNTWGLVPTPPSAIPPNHTPPGTLALKVKELELERKGLLKETGLGLSRAKKQRTERQREKKHRQAGSGEAKETEITETDMKHTVTNLRRFVFAAYSKYMAMQAASGKQSDFYIPCLQQAHTELLQWQAQ